VGFLANLHGNGCMQVYKNSTHCQLAPPRAKTVAHIQINLTLTETRDPGEHFLTTVWEYLRSFSHSCLWKWGREIYSNQWQKQILM